MVLAVSDAGKGHLLAIRAAFTAFGFGSLSSARVRWKLFRTAILHVFARWTLRSDVFGAERIAVLKCSNFDVPLAVDVVVARLAAGVGFVR